MPDSAAVVCPPAMSDAPDDQDQAPAKAPQSADVEPKDDKPGKGDAIAIGIGCAVFIIMFVAIVLVGMSGR